MGKKPVKYSLVDAFTDSAFKGNPAAVCFLEEERDDQWLQAVAAEFNVSQTCYLTRIAESESETDSSAIPRFRIRWFTPVSEVKLCGHATLAASHCLFTSGLVKSTKIEFLTLSGVLTAKRVPETKQIDPLNSENDEAHGNCFLIELDFPATKITEFDSAETPLVSKALNGASTIDLKRTTAEDVFVVLLSGKAVADLQPQIDEIKQCPGRGVIVTGIAPSGSGLDFISRFFCPKLGINEDPVCGTAHCALATYWSKKLGKCDLIAYQASPRGGILNLHFDETSQRVLLRGKSIIVMEGSILV